MPAVAMRCSLPFFVAVRFFVRFFLSQRSRLYISVPARRLLSQLPSFASWSLYLRDSDLSCPNTPAPHPLSTPLSCSLSRLSVACGAFISPAAEEQAPTPNAHVATAARLLPMYASVYTWRTYDKAVCRGGGGGCKGHVLKDEEILPRCRRPATLSLPVALSLCTLPALSLSLFYYVLPRSENLLSNRIWRIAGTFCGSRSLFHISAKKKVTWGLGFQTPPGVFRIGTPCVVALFLCARSLSLLSFALFLCVCARALSYFL